VASICPRQQYRDTWHVCVRHPKQTKPAWYSPSRD
jgi:hypothetical protein